MAQRWPSRAPTTQRLSRLAGANRGASVYDSESVPGGVDGFVHFRVILEQHLAESSDLLSSIDVDFKNANLSLE